MKTALSLLLGFVLAVAAIAILYLTATANTNYEINKGILWFAALSFFSSAGGLIALVWTFSEQRKLSVSQTRAYLEVLGGRYIPFEDRGAPNFRIGIKNVGQTPANNIRIIGETIFDPGAIAGNKLGAIVSTPFDEMILVTSLLKRRTLLSSQFPRSKTRRYSAMIRVRLDPKDLASTASRSKGRSTTTTPLDVLVCSRSICRPSFCQTKCQPNSMARGDRPTNALSTPSMKLRPAMLYAGQSR